MAAFRLPRYSGGNRLVLEDDCAVRLELEWTRLRSPRDAQPLLRRYERNAGRLTRRAHRRDPVAAMPPGWRAASYEFRETVPTRRSRPGLTVVPHRMASGLYVAADGAFLCLAVAHAYPGDQEETGDVLRGVAEDFRRHEEPGLIPWALYDLAFELPPDFELADARFDIGAKLLVFRWHSRRFFLWHFSCADAFLKDGAAAEPWVAGYLNAFSGLHGPVFSPGLGRGRLAWRRRRRYPLGHRDEIVRACWRYEARCRWDRKRNQLVAWVFHHRRAEDLEAIPPDLRFDQGREGSLS